MENPIEHKCPRCRKYMYLVRSDTRYHYFVCPEDHKGIGEVVEPVLITDLIKKEKK